MPLGAFGPRKNKDQPGPSIYTERRNEDPSKRATLAYLLNCKCPSNTQDQCHPHATHWPLAFNPTEFCWKSRMLREGQGEDRISRVQWQNFQPLSGVWGVITTEHGEQSTWGQTDRRGSPSLAPLAQALVCADVGFAAGTCVRHILEVIDEAGDQAAAQVTPHEAAEETQHKVHQAYLVGDLGGNGLLAVRTHCLHWGAFKDLSLQYCHRGGCP